MRPFTAATFISAVSASNVAIYHRILHPNLPAQPYLNRGSLDVSLNPPTFVSSPDLVDHLVSFSGVLESLQDSNEALYQVALEHEGDTSDALWDISSVKVVSLSCWTEVLIHPFMTVSPEHGVIRDNTPPSFW